MSQVVVQQGLLAASMQKKTHPRQVLSRLWLVTSWEQPPELVQLVVGPGVLVGRLTVAAWVADQVMGWSPGRATASGRVVEVVGLA